MALTEKQKRFADEYLIDLNATRAYKAAYPNIKKDETAAAAGARLLKNVKVAEYIELGDATKAATKAKYSKKSATVIGAENLTKPNIKQYIELRQKEADEKRIAKGDEVLQYLTKVMRGDCGSNGEPYFIGKDVTHILEYQNGS